MPNLRRHHPLERLAHLPGADRERALSHPILGDLVVVYAGYFPDARGHCIDRPTGYDSHQIALIESGRGVMHVGRRKISMGPGDLFLARGDGPVFYRADEGEPWSLRWVHFTGRRATALVEGGAFSAKHPVRHLEGAHRTSCARELDGAIAAVERAGGRGDVLLGAEALRRLCISLGEDPRAKGPSRFIERVTEALGPDLGGSLSITEWASRVGLSPTQFRVRVKAETGESPLAFVTRLRLERSRDFLRFKGGSVSRAAQVGGFPDPFYFSRRYRQIFGYSPKEDRDRATP